MLSITQLFFSPLPTGEGLGAVSYTHLDTSLIADIYTEVAGRASFMVSIPRSRKAAVKPVLDVYKRQE